MSGLKKMLERYYATGRAVEMMYTDKKGNISHRNIRILSVEETYVRAYCFTKKTMRTFAIDQMLAIAPILKRKRIRHSAS